MDSPELPAGAVQPKAPAAPQGRPRPRAGRKGAKALASTYQSLRTASEAAASTRLPDDGPADDVHSESSSLLDEILSGCRDEDLESEGALDNLEDSCEQASEEALKAEEAEPAGWLEMVLQNPPDRGAFWHEPDPDCSATYRTILRDLDNETQWPPELCSPSSEDSDEGGLEGHESQLTMFHEVAAAVKAQIVGSPRITTRQVESMDASSLSVPVSLASVADASVADASSGDPSTTDTLSRDGPRHDSHSSFAGAFREGAGSPLARRIPASYLMQAGSEEAEAGARWRRGAAAAAATAEGLLVGPISNALRRCSREGTASSGSN
mmetsp:Transcript_99467/g.320722  ORF Transcript_99467/g.320722 Transcript_99467/m.320722 type:complete len:324 (-) Transcript_99467:54-1025(-)